MWGEVSAGVNFFNPSANTSVFAKLDVTFGDNIEGFGGKAGIGSVGRRRLKGTAEAARGLSSPRSRTSD
jgi:hypothetical protein